MTNGVKAVIRIETSKKFMDFLKRIRYESLCKFIKDMVEDGGINLGYWMTLPEDLKITCVEPKDEDGSNTLVRLRNLSRELDGVYVETVRYEELVEETAKRVRDKSIAMYALLMLVKEMFNKVELSLTEVRSSLSNIVWDMEGEEKEKEGENKND